MREITIIQEMQSMGQVINGLADETARLRNIILGADARIRVHEDILLRNRGSLLWIAVRNLFQPDTVKLEILSRFKAYAEGKPLDKIKITTEAN